MKTLCLVVAVLLLCLGTVYAGGVLDFTADTSPTPDDIVYVINDPAGTPGDRKDTLGDLPKAMNVVDMADWPSGLSATELSYVNGVTSAIQDQLNAKESSTSNDIDPDRLAGDTEDDDLIDAAIIGDLSDIYDAAGLAAAAADASIAKSVVVAAGDVLVGTDVATPGVITKGANNSIFGVDNAGTLGFYTNFTPVLTSAPTSDDTYTGTITSWTAGEALAQWDVVYCKNGLIGPPDQRGKHVCYKYDADGADKALPPRGVAVAAIDADAAGVFLVEGIVRNDGWAQTTNQDEGKKVYGSTTAGLITLTEPAQDGVEIGFVVEQNVVYFKFNNLGVSTGSGAPVKADSPIFVDDITVAAAGVKLTGANGSLTILGLGDGQDEDIKIDLNTTANTITVTSPASSATKVSTPLALASTGIITGKIGILEKTTNYTLGSGTADEAYGYMIIVKTTGSTVTMPTAVTGMSSCIYAASDITVRVNPANADSITLNGASGSAGVDIYSAGDAGDFICLIATSAGLWTTLGRSGTWTSGSGFHTGIGLIVLIGMALGTFRGVFKGMNWLDKKWNQRN